MIILYQGGGLFLERFENIYQETLLNNRFNCCEVNV